MKCVFSVIFTHEIDFCKHWAITISKFCSVQILKKINICFIYCKLVAEPFCI